MFVDYPDASVSYFRRVEALVGDIGQFSSQSVNLRSIDSTIVQEEHLLSIDIITSRKIAVENQLGSVCDFDDSTTWVESRTFIFIILIGAQQLITAGVDVEFDTVATLEEPIYFGGGIVGN